MVKYDGNYSIDERQVRRFREKGFAYAEPPCKHVAGTSRFYIDLTCLFNPDKPSKNPGWAWVRRYKGIPDIMIATKKAVPANSIRTEKVPTKLASATGLEVKILKSSRDGEIRVYLNPKYQNPEYAS